ncbi:carbohydrate esterase family 8 protein [Dothistroma septosporum NZE10]|uniref:pectinesterase n=1 Tax=Dothistroma septosporum (strain NZE10 / CBS 128990) TaxID=675120 RepID=N1PG34_DOTSN|nr:carbohydrate esterase family 8 protein [Dothistroma septosporum NZE10]
MSRKASLLIGLFRLSTSFALSLDRTKCQAPTENPLDGCPQGTLLVGANQTFTCVQSAILSLPKNNDSYTILVLPGDYTEQVNVTRHGPVTILGQTFHLNNASANLVNIIWHNATGTAATGTYDNAYTSTLTIAPTFNSSLTGSGPTGNAVPAGTPFGNVNFRAYNLNFINDYLPYSAGPSLALSVCYANAGFYYSQFLSYQDTVYVGKLGNTYMHECTIGGQTDFFYGFGTLWVENSQVLLRGCGGGITAWKGTNTTYENKHGVYIHDSQVIAANDTLNITHKCALGRPWNALHRSIFSKSYLDDSVLPAGYIDWSTTDPRANVNTTMAEYRDRGPGFNATARAASNITIELTSEQYERYSTPEKVFAFPFTGTFGNTAWIDRDPQAC